MDIDEQANFLEAGWAVISGAPFYFLAVCLIAVGIIYAVFRELHGASLKNKDSTIETLRERLEWTEKQRDDAWNCRCTLVHGGRPQPVTPERGTELAQLLGRVEQSLGSVLRALINDDSFASKFDSEDDIERWLDS